MRNILLCLSLLLPVCFVVNAQKVSGKLSFEQGKTLTITVDVKNTIAQQAMGQSIDFNITGNATHFYTATNVAEDFFTLHHEAKQMSFAFDGMGAKRNFNSDNKKDMDGQLGEPIKKLLSQKYDLIIDPAGKAVMVNPEKFETPKTDERLVVIVNMLKDLTGIVNPPQKGTNSFFKVLPDNEVGIGDSWTVENNTENERSTTVHTLSAITDSTIVVDFTSKATTTQKGEMMGMETSTNMKSTTTGKIILDKTTGIIKEKTSTTDATGNTEAMGNSMPVTGKMTIKIVVSKS